MFMNYIIRELEKVLESYFLILGNYTFFKTSLLTVKVRYHRLFLIKLLKF